MMGRDCGKERFLLFPKEISNDMAIREEVLKGSFNAQRITTLQSHLGKDLSSFYLTHPLDLLYFTGLDLSAGLLIVDGQGAKLLVDSRYIIMAKSLGNIHVIPITDKESHLPKK